MKQRAPCAWPRAKERHVLAIAIARKRPIAAKKSSMRHCERLALSNSEAHPVRHRPVASVQEALFAFSRNGLHLIQSLNHAVELVGLHAAQRLRIGSVTSSVLVTYRPLAFPRLTSAVIAASNSCLKRKFPESFKLLDVLFQRQTVCGRKFLAQLGNLATTLPSAIIRDAA